MFRKFRMIMMIIMISLLTPKLYALQNTIVAKVGNSTVSSYDLKNKIRTSLILSNQEINQNNINKIKKDSVDSLIQKKN